MTIDIRADIWLNHEDFISHLSCVPGQKKKVKTIKYITIHTENTDLGLNMNKEERKANV